jgi:hypothetical protein
MGSANGVKGVARAACGLFSCRMALFHAQLAKFFFGLLRLRIVTVCRIAPSGLDERRNACRDRRNGDALAAESLHPLLTKVPQVAPPWMLRAFPIPAKNQEFLRFLRVFRSRFARTREEFRSCKDSLNPFIEPARAKHLHRALREHFRCWFYRRDRA